MKENNTYYFGWTIEWDNQTSGGFRFWIREPIYFSDSYLDTALHHMNMFTSAEEGIKVCKELISKVITEQAALTYQLVSEYHHSQNLPNPFEQDDGDDIPF